MLKKIKRITECIPYPIGNKLAIVPFELRLGSEYLKFKKKIKCFKKADEKQQLDFVIKQFAAIFEYAKKHYPFYNELYKKSGVYDLNIKSLDDIKQIPIINKKMIRPTVDSFSGKFKLNTGGTSGMPFSFYADKHVWAREWAHMHDIWGEKNYHRTDLKLTLRGKNIENNNFIYNPVHNEYILNIYKAVQDFRDELLKLFKKRKIKFLHGYPSAVFNFLKQAEKVFSNDELDLIKKNLRGILLGSEFPLKNQVECFNEHNLDYISWYGHSEMCILAKDIDKLNRYVPYYTYGMAEAEDNHLIGTSYFNYDMPLIRYDTDDLVEGDYANNGLLKYFTVTEGRKGDFVIDADGNKIALTALIFGRHHHCFDLADSVQVRQVQDGIVELMVSNLQDNASHDIDELFDLNNVNIKFTLTLLAEPILSTAGKFKLKID
jgi:phenylacetate-coenzyme A ligase PaaK-like adenylate-forming protein